MAYIKEDKNRLAELYGRMANSLAAELQRGWTHFCMGFFVDASGSEEMLIYVSENEGRSWRDFMDDVFAADDIMTGVFDCKEACQELYALCAKAGDRWSCFTLTVDCDGNFNAEFKYESFKELNPVLKNMWMGEYLA